MFVSYVAIALFLTVIIFAAIDEIGKRRETRKINTMLKQEAMRRMNEEWDAAARFELHRNEFFWEVTRWNNDI